jgi:transcriptional regulator with XRE-family HTH domain
MNEFDKLFQNVRETSEWDIEGAKLQITNAIHRFMKEENVTQNELAKRLGKSQPYVSKILKGETNFTIESIALIARALNATFQIHLSQKRPVSGTRKKAPSVQKSRLPVAIHETAP